MKAPNADTLTRPELSTAKRDRNRIAKLIVRKGACQFCVHRVQGWGFFACTMPGRTYPVCLDKPVVTFALDESTLPPELRGQAAEQ